MKNKKIRWILASTSPRRRVLLKKLGHPFKVIPSYAPEVVKRNETPRSLVRRLAILKAETVAKKFKKHSVRHQIIAADTVVVLKGKIFGKPKSIKYAVKMLSELSDKTHQVYSGVAVTDTLSKTTKSQVEVTRVTVKKISPELALRVARKHQDKSGSYACQDKKDNIVKRMRGDWQNVVGLPLKTLKKILSSFKS